MRCAVVGHVEWVEFVRVEAMPAAGEIVHATETWDEPAGGGAVIARQLARLAGRCELFTALGDDELGRAIERRLAELGVDVHARRGEPHDERGRTSTAKASARSRCSATSSCRAARFRLHGYDAVFFVSGDVEALRSARAAGFLAATLRQQPTLHEAGVPIDLLVGSAQRPARGVRRVARRDARRAHRPRQRRHRER